MRPRLIAMHSRLSIRFNEEGKHYTPCRWVQINYDNGDHLSAEHKDKSDDVITYFKPELSKDGKNWKIEPNDGHYIKCR